MFGDDRIPKYDIDYGVHQGKKYLHIHYYNEGVRSKEPIKINTDDEMYKKHKGLFKGVKL